MEQILQSIKPIATYVIPAILAVIIALQWLGTFETVKSGFQKVTETISTIVGWFASKKAKITLIVVLVVYLVVLIALYLIFK